MNPYQKLQKAANDKEMARTYAGMPDAERIERLPGNDMIEAAIITTERAALYLRPECFYPEMYKDAVALAQARAATALAVEIKLLRLALQNGPAAAQKAGAE